MTTGGIILIACILTIFAAFAITLAWGVHQTNSVLRERAKAKAKVVDFAAVQPTEAARALRAA